MKKNYSIPTRPSTIVWQNEDWEKTAVYLLIKEGSQQKEEEQLKNNIESLGTHKPEVPGRNFLRKNKNTFRNMQLKNSGPL